LRQHRDLQVQAQRQNDTETPQRHLQQYDKMGSVVLPHLVSGWHVDQAIMSEEERLVIIRFGRDWDPDCMRQDEVLYREFSLAPPRCLLSI